MWAWGLAKATRSHDAWCMHREGGMTNATPWCLLHVAGEQGVNPRCWWGPFGQPCAAPLVACEVHHGVGSYL